MTHAHRHVAAVVAALLGLLVLGYMAWYMATVKFDVESLLMLILGVPGLIFLVTALWCSDPRPARTR